MGMALLIAKRGTCTRGQVGAVVSRDARVIAMGYNGAPAGLPHCDHTDEQFKWELGHEVLENIEWAVTPGKIMEMPAAGVEITTGGCQIAVHAEQNAIAFAARHGVALDGADLHCTHAPCASCARSIINAGIRRVFYATPYRLTDGIELLNMAGLEVFDMSDDAL